MTKASRVKKPSNNAVGSSTFRTEFASYYPPTDDDLQRFVTEGLVVLDTNAVLDLYRFTDTTREEYFDALGLLGERLWIPNRVGEEFYDRRTTVIRERQGIRAVIAEQVAEPVEAVVAAVAGHARRHGLDGDTAAAVREGVLAALEPVIREIEGTVGGVTIDPDAHPDSDPILTQICELFDEKTGTAFDEKQSSAAQNQHKTRLAGHVPPGYCDSKKNERAIGDFLVWKQTINEATERKLPVLLVTNEKKEDWVFRDGGYTMPRVELVREMKRTAGCDFHLIDVRTFLALAKEYLAAQISEAAVDEAARVSDVAAAASQQETAITRAALAGMREAFSGVDVTTSLRGIAAGYDPTAEIRRITAGYDPTAEIRKLAAGYDPTAEIRRITAGYDPAAEIRRITAGYDPTAEIRKLAAGYDPAAEIRNAMAAATPRSSRAPKTLAKASSTPQKKATSAEPAAKRAAAKKPGPKKKHAAKEKPAE
ncbi:PIN-like domain-containing protein [Nocardia sp. NPDC050408]|uniref:PIN-like domain-containing protein n=1 Tax=Nocardia sp. NPDC050408 TaxID=3364319 RepID=UPI0037B93BEA